MTKIVEIEGLSKEYEKGFLKKKRTLALDGLNLKVEANQVFGFLGGNGAGKSTTIKILMRSIFPNAGTARILGSDISDVSMHARIGYCPEHPYFYDYLKPLELLDYFGELFGLDAKTRETRSKELLRRVNLDEKDWNRPLRKFSKGMLQRVGIAQSLINQPEIVFLDEPMSGLDPIGRRDIRELITEIREAGKTVFMSSHILSDIEALCDNVAILRKGKLVAEGNLNELLTKSGEAQSFDITVNGVLASELKRVLGNIKNAQFIENANGATIRIDKESEITIVIDTARKAGGTLVSVHPVKLALEEFFVESSDN